MDNNEWLGNAIKLYESGNHKDGDVLSHEWLKYALDIPEPKTMSEVNEVQWITLSRVESFKDWLLTEKQTALRCVRGEGYWIVPPSDQARLAAEEAMRYIQKGLNKGNKILNHARLSDMNDDEKRRHTDTQVRLSGIGSLMQRQKRDVFALFDPAK